MNEVKITREQFDHLETIRYDRPQKFKYIKDKIIHENYDVDIDTTFFTYKDKWNYYLVFDGLKFPNEKIKPSSIVERLKDEKLKETL